MMAHSVDNDAEIELQPSRHRLNSGHDGETQASNDGIAIEYPWGVRLVLIILALSLTMFLGALDSTIVSQAVPSITQQFGDIGNITWYSTAYALANTSFKMVWGKAFECFRLKRTHLLAILIFEVGNVICALAKSSATVILGRFVSGIGGGGLMCGSFIISALSVRPERRPLMMSITGVTFACSSVVGPVLGGVLVDSIGWRWCFWINLPIGALATGLIITFFRQPRHVRPLESSLTQKLIKMDLNGAAIVTACLSCFVLAMDWISSYSPRSPQVIGSLLGFALLVALTVANERLMGSKAMIQARLLRNKTIARNSIFAFFLAGAFAPLLYILPLRFQSVENETAAQSGIRLIPFVLGISLFTLVVNSVLTLWTHFTPFLALGGLLATIGAAVMYTYKIESTSSWIGAEILASAGIGTALQIPMLANQAAVGVQDIPAATSLALFLEGVGTTMFVAATEGAFTSDLIKNVKHNLPGVSPSTVANTSLTELRSSFSATEVRVVVKAYLEAFRTGQLVPVACGGLATLLAIVNDLPSILNIARFALSKPRTA